MNEEILAAARELGDALHEMPEVQAFLRADEAYRGNAEVQELQQKMEQAYNDLIQRQRAGEMLFQHEVNAFYHLRDQLMSHPLMIEREMTLAVVKTLFEQAGGTISSILSVDYTKLALSDS